MASIAEKWGHFCLELLFPARLEGLLASKDGRTLLERLPSAPYINEHDTWALFSYQDERVARLIHLLKFENSREAARLLAEALHEAYLSDFSDLVLFQKKSSEKILLIPIPISKHRLEERGYNQCERLVEALARTDSEIFSVAKCLVKTRETAPQSRATREERLKNLRGSFAVLNPEKIRGRVCVVVDDVFTTGATFAEARRVLEKSGAEKIVCVAAAH